MRIKPYSPAKYRPGSNTNPIRETGETLMWISVFSILLFFLALYLKIILF